MATVKMVPSANAIWACGARSRASKPTTAQASRIRAATPRTQASQNRSAQRAFACMLILHQRAKRKINADARSVLAIVRFEDRMRKAPLGLLALLAAPMPGAGPAPPAAVETMYMTGETLLRTCQEAESAVAGATAYNFADVIECTSYISGALDQQTQSHIAAGSPATICVPVGVTKGQLAVVFVRYARGHADQQKLIATDLVSAAMRDAYPCP